MQGAGVHFASSSFGQDGDDNAPIAFQFGGGGGGASADLEVAKNKRIAWRRLTVLESLALAAVATSLECIAALQAAHHDFSRHWPSEWTGKETTLLALGEAVNAAEQVASTTKPEEVVVVLDVFQDMGYVAIKDAKIRYCARNLIIRLCHLKLAELARLKETK